jgi:Rod binding domain-containing protein
MSALPALASTGAAGGLPLVSPATEPEFVRKGSATVKSAYQEALGFEEMLVEELTKSMSEAGGLGEGGQAGEGEGEEGASTNMLTSMMPQTLSETLTRGGGLGLAKQLTSEIDPSALSEATARVSR